MAPRKTLMHSAALTPPNLSNDVRQALEISLRGVQELLPQDEWVKKLQRAQASGQPLRIKLGLDPTALKRLWLREQRSSFSAVPMKRPFRQRRRFAG